MVKEWKIKYVGLLLLGTGVLIVALVVAHWYFFEILPRMHAEDGVHSWCNVRKGVATVNLRADGVNVENVEVNVGGTRCTYETMYPGTHQVCTADVDTNRPVTYSLKYKICGRTIEESGTCTVFEPVRPVVD